MLRGGIPSRSDVTLNSCGNSDASDDNFSGDELTVSGRAAFCLSRDFNIGFYSNISV